MWSSRFDVFISYARAVSTPLAADLQYELERFAKKWNQIRAIRVFRDESSLPANSRLWSTIESAMTTARYFILIASPESAASEYVDNEVQLWLEHKNIESILLVHDSGELAWSEEIAGFTPDSAVPPVLRHAFPEEPRWVDMTWFGQPGSAGRADPRFMERVADLAAPVRGVDRDALIGANLAEHRKTMRRSRIVIATLAAFLVAALVAGSVAVTERNTARRLYADAIGERVAPEAERILRGEIPGGIGRGLQGMLVAQKLKSSPDPGAYLNAMVAATQIDKVVTMVRGRAARSLSRIATVSAEKPDEIQIWDTDLNAVGVPIRTGNDSYPMAFSHDEKILAVAKGNGLIELWDLTAPANVGAIQLPHDNGQDGPVVTDVIFSPDDKGLVVRTNDDTVRFYGSESKQQTAAAITDTAWILAPPDGSVLAVAPLDGSQVEIRNPLTGNLIGEPLPVSRELDVNDCRSFDQAGDRLVVNSEVHDVPTRTVVGKSADLTWDCVDQNIALSPDGTTVLVGGGSVRLAETLQSPGDFQIPATLLSSGGPFLGVDWLDGRNAVAVSRGGLFKIAFDPPQALRSVDANKVVFGAREGAIAIENGATVTGYRGETALRPIEASFLLGAGGDFFYTLKFGSLDEWSFQDGSRKRGLPLLLDGDTTVFHLLADNELRNVVAHTDRGSGVAVPGGGTLRRWDFSAGRPIGNALRVPETVKIEDLLDVDGALVTALTRNARTANDGGSVWTFDLDSGTSTELHAFDEPVAAVATCRDSNGTPTWMIGQTDGGIGFAKGPLTDNIPWSHPPSLLHEGFRFGEVMLSEGCRTAASWNSGLADDGTLQFWDVDSGGPLGNPISSGRIIGEQDGKFVVSTREGVTKLRIVPERPTAADLCAKLTTNMSRKQWDAWISPDIPYQKACPDLPIASDG